MLYNGSFKGKLLKNHVGRIWQSITLIASNAAAVLPAYWALRHKVVIAHLEINRVFLFNFPH